MISFTVFGVPQPQGSKTPYVMKGGTRAGMFDSNKKTIPWRQEVSRTALAAMNEDRAALIPRPLAVLLEASFYFEKPKSVKKAVLYKTAKPDLDKLLRAIGDGLTEICYEDDSQIAQCVVTKLFGSPARVEITVMELHSAIPFSAVPI